LVRSRAYLRYALGLLVAVYTFNFIDRQILVILQESIKQEMGLSDGQLGLLSGFSFAIFYATLGIPIARVADQGIRRNVIAWAIAVWSVMTVICGLARSYAQLLVARIGVAIGEAGGSPPAHAMISDYFPPRERGRALAIYSTGVYLGILFGFLAGGWLNEFFGWRVAFMVVGVPGLLVAALVRLTLTEPRRGESEGHRAAEPAPPLRDSLKTLWNLRSFRYLGLAFGFTAFVTYGNGNFGPSFLARTFQLSSGEIGTVLGLFGGLGGMAGTYLGGFLGDRLGGRDIRWYLWVPAIALLIAIPLRLAAYLVDDLRLVYPLLASTELLFLTFLAPSLAVAHALVAPALRAFTSSILFFGLSVIGLGMGPTFAGFLSDQLTPSFGIDGLRWSMAITSLAALPAAGLYLMAAARVRGDLAAAS
jgi:predicted MFS family arabinose efflux permease